MSTYLEAYAAEIEAEDFITNMIQYFNSLELDDRSQQLPQPVVEFVDDQKSEAVQSVESIIPPPPEQSFVETDEIISHGTLG